MMIDKQKNKQVLLTLPNGLLEQIEDYRRHADPIPNRNEAIRELIVKGLNQKSDK